MTDKPDLATLADLLADLLEAQRKTHDAILSLAHAFADGRDRDAAIINQVAAKPQPKPKLDPEPLELDPEPSKSAETEEISLDGLRKTFAAKSQAGHKQALIALLADFGAKKLPDVAATDYADLMAKVEAL